ncbi:hypothetical protein GEMRC1_007899 [Eukaryota sp. GEM-RC1]
MSTAILSIFWSLVSNDEQKQCSAALELVSLLQTERCDFSAVPPYHESMDALQYLNTHFDSDLTYCLKRILRGISCTSQVKSGFLLAFIGLLSSFPILTPRFILSVCDSLNREAGNSPSCRESLLSRLFVLVAVIRSGSYPSSDVPFLLSSLQHLSSSNPALKQPVNEAINELFRTSKAALSLLIEPIRSGDVSSVNPAVVKLFNTTEASKLLNNIYIRLLGVFNRIMSSCIAVNDFSLILDCFSVLFPSSFPKYLPSSKSSLSDNVPLVSALLMLFYLELEALYSSTVNDDYFNQPLLDDCRVAAGLIVESTEPESISEACSVICSCTLQLASSGVKGFGKSVIISLWKMLSEAGMISQSIIDEIVDVLMNFVDFGTVEGPLEEEEDVEEEEEEDEDSEEEKEIVYVESGSEEEEGSDVSDDDLIEDVDLSQLAGDEADCPSVNQDDVADEEVDDDVMLDEASSQELEMYDVHLARIFKAKKEALDQGNNEKKKRNAELQFLIIVVELIETVCDLTQIFFVLPSLLKLHIKISKKLIRRTHVFEKQLLTVLQRCIEHFGEKLTSKEFSGDDVIPMSKGLLSLVSSMFSLIRSPSSAQLVLLLASYLIKSLSRVQDNQYNEFILEKMSDAISMIVSKTNSFFTFPPLKKLMEKNPVFAGDIGNLFLTQLLEIKKPSPYLCSSLFYVLRQSCSHPEYGESNALVLKPKVLEFITIFGDHTALFASRHQHSIVRFVTPLLQSAHVTVEEVEAIGTSGALLVKSGLSS